MSINSARAKIFTLKKEEFCFYKRVPTFEIEQYEDTDVRERVLAIRTFVMSNRQKFTTNIGWIRCPHTWWDHFLADAIPTFSKWFHLKPKYDTFDVKAHVNRLIIYPEIEPSTHEFQNYYVHDTINTNVVRSVK